MTTLYIRSPGCIRTTMYSENSVLEGRIMAIDLGARKFGTDLALAEVLLGDKLPDDMRKDISDHLQRRIIDCYLNSC